MLHWMVGKHAALQLRVDLFVVLLQVSHNSSSVVLVQQYYHVLSCVEPKLVLSPSFGQFGFFVSSDADSTEKTGQGCLSSVQNRD